MQSIKELWEALLDTEKPKWECKKKRDMWKSFVLTINFIIFPGVEDLSLLFANQFCNQRLFLQATQKISYSPLYAIVRATRQKVWLPVDAAMHFILHSCENWTQCKYENILPFLPLSLNYWSAQGHNTAPFIKYTSFTCNHFTAHLFTGVIVCMDKLRFRELKGTCSCTISIPSLS